MPITPRHRVLVVDDVKSNVDVLVAALRDEYLLSVALDGGSVLDVARKTKPDLVLLDIGLPGMDGYAVCRALAADPDTRDIPIILQTALSDAEDESRGLALGAVDYITKPFVPELLRARVRTHIALKTHRDKLEQLVRDRTLELHRTQTVMIESLSALAEYRDPETGGHIKRTQAYVTALALQARGNPRIAGQLTDEYIELLRISAPLHDVGKLGVPDDILRKPGRLTPEEFEQMKQHAVIGHDALRQAEDKLGGSSFLAVARELAHTHHEKWDGTGYPRGLRGDAIPLCGRLMAVADVYDALISKRTYKPPMPHDEAAGIIREGSGRHFDPDLVVAFEFAQETFRNIATTYADSEPGQDPSQVADAMRRLRTILVVEDHEVSREIMQSQLVAHGWSVRTAADGHEALDVLRRHPCDVLLTDMEMPIMTGMELAAAIRSGKGGANQPFILAITASEYGTTELDARAAGFDGFMLKPLEVPALTAKLAALSATTVPRPAAKTAAMGDMR